jgi:hypothetical protein
MKAEEGHENRSGRRNRNLKYMCFPHEQWLRIRMNNPLARINRKIRTRTLLGWYSPDGQSALMLGRLQHVAGSNWELSTSWSPY